MNWIQLIAYYILLIALTAATLPSHSVTDWIKVENITSSSTQIYPQLPESLYVHLKTEDFSDCYYIKTPPNVYKINCFNTIHAEPIHAELIHAAKIELFCIHLTDGFLCI